MEENANRVHFFIASNFVIHPQILIFSRENFGNRLNWTKLQTVKRWELFFETQCMAYVPSYGRDSNVMFLLDGIHIYVVRSAVSAMEITRESSL